MENRVQYNVFLYASVFFLSIYLSGSVLIRLFLYRKKLLSKINEQAIAQKILLNEVNHVAEIEREIISKNLHDNIGIQLSIVKLHLTKISRNLDDKQLSADLLVDSMKLLDDSIQNIRDIGRDISPLVLTKLGYAKAVAELCRRLNAVGSCNVEFMDNNAVVRLNQLTELQAYRIVQEILNNILKHAGASNIHIVIHSSEQRVITVITHNGAGLSEEMARELSMSGKGAGLINIQSRVELINASIHYDKKGDNEWIIQIEIRVYGK